MAFVPDQLLLPPDRRAQLERALATAAEPAPLETLCAEAEAEVDRLTYGWEIQPAVRAGWIRALALYAAYLAAGGGMPDAVRAAHDAARAELAAIAAGQRANLPRSTALDTPWGSQPALNFPRVTLAENDEEA